MKRHKGLYKLSHDHHHALVLSQLIKKGSPQFQDLPSGLEGKVNYTIKFYNEHLLLHFNEEEKILYPFIKKITESLDKIFTEIFSEHKIISSLVGELSLNIGQEDILNRLSIVIKEHVRKEERILFPEIEKKLDQGQLDELAVLLGSAEETGV